MSEQGCVTGAGMPTLQAASDGQSHVVTTQDGLPNPTVADYNARVTLPKQVNLRVPEGFTATASAHEDAGTVTVDANIYPVPKQTLKIAIVGKAPSSLGLAPYLDKEWGIWGLSDGWRNMPRPVTANDVWFELHDIDTGRKKRWPPEYFEWLKQNQDKCPLYVGHKLRVNKYSIADMTLEEVRKLDSETPRRKDLPHAIPYPIYEVLWRYGTYQNNSISLMMCLAALQGVSHVSLFGVDMAQSDPVTGQNGEYEHQRPSCEYMIGFLRGAGVVVHVPGEADLLKCKRLYAFETHGNEDEEDKKRIAREQELLQSIQKAEQIIQQQTSAVIARKGALDQMRYDFRRSR
jgi:hypothetical protein